MNCRQRYLPRAEGNPLLGPAYPSAGVSYKTLAYGAKIGSFFKERLFMGWPIKEWAGRTREENDAHGRLDV